MKTISTPTFLDMKLYGLIYGFLRAIGRLPRPVAVKLGCAIGYIAYGLGRKHRKIALDNLAHALGREYNTRSRRRLARAVFNHLGQILFEIGWSISASSSELRRAIRIDGLDNYSKAFNQGNGVLVITAHIGNWELLPVVADRARIPLNVVYRSWILCHSNSFSGICGPVSAVH